MNSRRQWLEFSGLTALAFFALCLISAVHISVAIRTTLLFVYLAVCGWTLISWLLPMSSVATKLGLGLTSMIILWTASDQSLRSWQYRELAILAPALIPAVSRPRSSRLRSQFTKGAEDDNLVSPISIFLVSVLLLAHIWPWTLTFALSSLLVLIIYWFCTVRSDGLPMRPQIWGVTTLLPVGGLVISLVTREKYWWLPKYGLDEMEVHSNSVFEWGPAQDHYAAGINHGYQWFHFGFAGLLEHFISAPDWVVGTRIDFIVGVFLSATLLLGFNAELTRSRSKILLAAVWSAVFATPLFYPNHWGVMAVNHRGLVAALCIGVLTAGLSWSKHQYSWSGLLPLWLCAFALIASKTAAAVPLGLILGAAALLALVDRRWSHLVRLSVLGTAILLPLVFTVRSSSGLTFEWKQPGRAIAALFLGIDRYLVWVSGSILQRLLLGIILVVLVLGVSISGLVVAFSMFEDRDLRRFAIMLSTALVGGFVLFVFGSRISDTHFHFLQVPATLMIPIGASISTSLMHNLFLRRHTSLSGGAAMTIAALVSLGMIGFASCFIENDRLSYVTGASTICLAAALPGYLVIRSRINSARATSLPPWRTMTTAVFVIGLFFGLGNWISLKNQSLFKSGVTQGQLGSIELQDVSTWISSNSSSSEIIATNISLDLSLSAECTTAIAQLTQPPDNPITVAMLMERRFLTIRPEIAELVSGQDLSARVSASIEFSCTGSDIAARRLRELGANWYLAYLPNASKLLVEKTQYRTAHYGLVSLRSP